MRYTVAVTAVAMLAAIALPFAAPQSSAEETGTTATPLLSHIKTFEADLFRGTADLSNPLYPREVATYVNRHLQQSNEVQFASPADGVIHMECQGVNCYMIKTTVTVGQNGPVVWQDNQATGKAGMPCYKRTIFPCPLKDERKVAGEIVGKLLEARRKVMAGEQSTVNYTAPPAAQESK